MINQILLSNIVLLVLAFLVAWANCEEDKDYEDLKGMRKIEVEVVSFLIVSMIILTFIKIWS